MVHASQVVLHISLSLSLFISLSLSPYIYYADLLLWCLPESKLVHLVEDCAAHDLQHYPLAMHPAVLCGIAIDPRAVIILARKSGADELNV